MNKNLPTLLFANGMQVQVPDGTVLSFNPLSLSPDKLRPMPTVQFLSSSKTRRNLKCLKKCLTYFSWTPFVSVTDRSDSSEHDRTVMGISSFHSYSITCVQNMIKMARMLWSCRIVAICLLHNCNNSNGAAIFGCLEYFTNTSSCLSAGKQHGYPSGPQGTCWL